MDALTDSDSITRRVSAEEVKRRIPCSETWLRHLIATGAFPSPKRDPGGRRRFWMNDEVAAAIRGLYDRGVKGAPGVMPSITGGEPRRRHAARLAARGSSTGSHTSYGDGSARPVRTTTPTKHDAGVRRSTKAPDDGTPRN